MGSGFRSTSAAASAWRAGARRGCGLRRDRRWRWLSWCQRRCGDDWTKVSDNSRASLARPW